MDKNRFMLKGRSAKRGYDWWWHSLTATDPLTGELRPFFIEYYVINPSLRGNGLVLGQSEESRINKKRPCYAMIKAGSWGKDGSQLHDFFDISEFQASAEKLDCRIGGNTLTENSLRGSVNVSEAESRDFPERMSDAGTMSWDLRVKKELVFDAGYGSSALFSRLGLFSMYWHVGGMRCRYSGEIVYNGRRYEVLPETSFGYQDKNWGKDYTNPWIWLNCNNFISAQTGERADASLDIGGGCPVIAGIALDRRILTAFYYKGIFIEFNFSKFWKRSKQSFVSREDDYFIYWDVEASNKRYGLEISFRCEKEKMLLVHYENPDGEKKHSRLWNGGHAEGTVRLYNRKGKQLRLLDELKGSLGGCEYGEYLL